MKDEIKSVGGGLCCLEIFPRNTRLVRAWNDYRNAVEEMIEKTSTAWAPWTVVEANDKFYARVKVVQSLTKALEAV